jgi:hypothetical protein
MRSARLRGHIMAENHPWQLRARKAGLTQRMLARITGFRESTVSSQLRGHWTNGVPQHIRAIIIAWEAMATDQRLSWLAQMEAEAAASPASAGETSSDQAEDAGQAKVRELEQKVLELSSRLAEVEAKR